MFTKQLFNQFFLIGNFFLSKIQFNGFSVVLLAKFLDLFSQFLNCITLHIQKIIAYPPRYFRFLKKHSKTENRTAGEECKLRGSFNFRGRSEEHTSELQSRENLVC